MTTIPALAVLLGILMVDGARAGAKPREPEPTPPPAVRQDMPPGEPMAGAMKKEGMTKGDVRRAAARKEAEMQELLAREARARRTAAR